MIASKIRATHFFDMQSGWRLAWKPHGPIRNNRIAGHCTATAKLPRDGVKGSFGTFVQMAPQHSFWPDRLSQRPQPDTQLLTTRNWEGSNPGTFAGPPLSSEQTWST